MIRRAHIGRRALHAHTHTMPEYSSAAYVSNACLLETCFYVNVRQPDVNIQVFNPMTDDTLDYYVDEDDDEL